jgi:hypothetical protein
MRLSTEPAFAIRYYYVMRGPKQAETCKMLGIHIRDWATIC